MKFKVTVDVSVGRVKCELMGDFSQVKGSLVLPPSTELHQIIFLVRRRDGGCQSCLGEEHDGRHWRMHLIQSSHQSQGYTPAIGVYGVVSFISTDM